MTELDPYGTLGVPRTASRAEIARAYRALAKAHHPDAGAGRSAAMTRINAAWNILSDPQRRARWDRLHPAIAVPLWRPTPVEPARRPPPAAVVPPSAMDSGWKAFGVVAGVAVLIGVLMMGISAAARPVDDRVRFTSDELSFVHPRDWTAAAGGGKDPAAHRVIVHLATFPVAEAELCTEFTAECPLVGGDIPPGGASILVTAHEGGQPPIPNPIVSRPFGLDARLVIGGAAAALEVQRTGVDSLVAWWQLSPPGFPDRWIEVRADIGGLPREADEALADVQAILETVEFGE